MKNLTLWLLTVAGLIVYADPTVTDVKAQQRYPWNGLVDIVVTMEGVSAEEVPDVECLFVATNSATGSSLPIASITRKGSDTGSGTTWKRRFVWDAAKDVGVVKIDDVALTVNTKVEREVQLWENGPYWAKCNVGATKPEEYGYYFWWGDTVGYKRNAANNGWISVKDGSSFLFSGSNCPTHYKDNSALRSAGYIDATGNLVAAHDAATAHLGALWRMPTASEIDALISNCDTQWTTRNGVYGRLVTGRGAYASKSIFLPAAGYGNGSYLDYTGSNGLYWSSTPDSDFSYFAWHLDFGSGYIGRFHGDRYGGQSVRPIRGFANGVISDLPAGVSVTTHIKLDCRTGTRTAAESETITYSTEWVEGAGEGAVSVVSVNGQVISEQLGSGTINWTPTRTGTYKLTHKVMVDGEQIGEDLIATYWVDLMQVADVTAQQRYPWNGKVDIFYTVKNAGTEYRELSIWAVDQTTGVTNVAKAVSGDTAYASGKHHVVWDMSADGLTLVSTNVVFAVSYKEHPLYCVIDLSGGTSASSYPVTYYDDVPSGGWSDEYKTTKLVLRKISAGTFTMGSPTGELGRWDDETQHQVTLTRDYYMGVFQVTQRQWELVMGTRPSYFNNNTYYAPRPVEQVSYNMIRGSSAGAGWPNSSAVDATSFLGVLRAKSGLQLDLPTEAQWEYACRAGTTTALNSGKNLTSEYQDAEMDKVGRYWHNGGSSCSQNCDWNAGTAKVGSYAPNAWGLYDMHGNVREWCLDWYGSYSSDATDPKGSSSGSNRVLRGGGWLYVATYCRSARRDIFGPSIVNNNDGFRLVRTLSNTEEVKIKSEKVKSESVVAATSGGAGGESDPVRVDLTSGTRTAAKTETITYSTEWVDGAGEGAIAVVSVKGEVISEQSGSGTVGWMPSRGGTNILTHIIRKDGAQVGETLTATFNVNGGPYTEVVDGVEWTYMAQDGWATLGSGDPKGPTAVPKTTEGSIVLPSRIGECIVNGVANYAFFESGVSIVTIPASVTSIGYMAFNGCGSLEVIVVAQGSSCYSSRDGVLFNRDQSVLVVCPNARKGAYVIPSGVTEIADGAFSSCLGLTEVIIPESVTRIGNSAFSGCSNLNAVDFEGAPPEGVADASIKQDAAIRYNGMYVVQWEAIAEQCGWTNAKPYAPCPFPEGGPYKETVDGVVWAFTVNADLMAIVGTGSEGGTAISSETAGTVVVPETLGGRIVTGVGAYAFKDCTGLTEVTLPTNIVTIGDSAFANDYWLDNVIIPDSVEEIGNRAFMNCTEMAALTFGKGLKRVWDSAFENCISLESVVFQEGLRYLGSRAFAATGATRLKSVSLPASLVSIGSSAFSNSALITGVTVPTHLQTLATLFPSSCQKIETVVIPEGEDVIVDAMFDGCSKLASVVIPMSVTNVGASAFANCSALVELGLPDEVTTLGARAFYGCMALKTVSLPRNLTAIADETFAVCPMLDSLVIPASVTSLGHKIYSGAKIGYYFTANLTAVNFLGDAPGTYSDSYEGMPSALKSYVIKGSRSWYMPGSPTLPPNGWPTTGNARDITYWTPNEFEVTFDGNGGSPETYVSKQITDTTYSLPKSDPVRDGYLFRGWWTEKEAGAQIYWNTRVTATKAHTLYAHWKSLVEMITVRFNPNGGTVEPSEKTYPPGVTFGELPVPTRIGHNFVGWYTSQVGGDLVTESTVVSKEHNELYAHWEPITYRVAFDANGGSGTMYDQTHTYNVALALTANAYYLTGFNFTGWSETRGGAVKYGNQQVVENLAEIQGQVVTLYAVWVGAKYAVRFDANGGEGIMANQTHQVGVPLALSKCTFTRENHTFLGWATTPQGEVVYEDEEEVQDLTLQASATVPLYAVWKSTGVEAPVFSPKDGTVFKGSCTVTLTCPTPGASIYYRIGAKPKATSKYLYSVPFEITETSTVYAFAKLGDTESECVTATYTKGKVITFEEAVKAKGITAFTHGGDAVWGVEEGLGEGDVCVRSGVIIDDQVSWFETTVQGPGTITFKWKASCEEDYPSHEWDHLAFNIDGAKDDYARLDGVTDWEEVSAKLEAGTHTLRWSYVKDESDAEGEDCGWVDCVTWVADAPAPVPPGGEIVVPEGKTAKEFADEVNKNKAQYLNWPLEGPVSTDYLGYFTAVPKGDAKVEFVLSEEGTNQVNEATTAAKTNTLESVLSKTGTLVIGDPLIGFYYSLKQGSDVTVGDKADLNKLAGRDTLSFPLTTDKSKYFYQSLVTPTPVPEE